MAATNWSKGRYWVQRAAVGVPAFGAVVLILAILYLAFQFHPSLLSRPLGRFQAVVLGWMLIGLIGYVGLLRLFKRSQIPIREEIGRWILIGIAALFLLNGVTRSSLHGGGDARWYATILADMVAQTRDGVFPVWIGQSEFQYNGAIYTLRVAPAFYYLGATFDGLTLHSLGIYALQNLMLVSLGLAAAFTVYFTLADLMKGRRTLAAGLALLFLSCPGVLGIVYNTDLYMSWTSLPLIPLVLYAGVRSFRDGGKASSMLLLGASLGACWWAHSPIAIWMTFISLVLQLVRCAVRAPTKKGWLAIGLCIAAFSSVSAYPIASVLLYPPDPIGGGLSIKPDTTADMIVDEVKSVYPADLLPVSGNGGQLSDFQLGYALWGLFLTGAVCVGLLGWESRALMALACLLVLLVAIPISHLDAFLWNVVPTFVRRITCEWVMNRLYLILAGIIVFSIAPASDKLASIWRGRLLYCLVALGCVWSWTEARKFLGAPPETPRNDALRSENVMLTQYAYFGFAIVPDYFTDGVDDPNLENRLLRDPAGGVIASNLTAAEKSSSDWTLANHSVVSDAIEESPISFRLEYGKRYLADFEFLKGNFVGVLQISSATSLREYALPISGGPTSFGIGGLHSNFLPLWTSNEAGEVISIRFLPDAVREKNLSLVARVSLNEYDPSRLPIHVYSWIPYQAVVQSPEPAWLETPRMFQSGYIASVNGHLAKVEKSKQGLVSVEIPAGRSKVEVDYRPPRGLNFLFWESVTALAVAVWKLIWWRERGSNGLRHFSSVARPWPSRN